MNRHLRAGWKTARVGLGISAFSIFSEGFGVVVFGDAPEWGLTLIVAALMTVLFGVGGVLYGAWMGTIGGIYATKTRREEFAAVPGKR